MRVIKLSKKEWFLIEDSDFTVDEIMQGYHSYHGFLGTKGDKVCRIITKREELAKRAKERKQKLSPKRS